MTSHHAELRIAPDHPAVAGHFPGNPIIPGAVLLRDIAAVIAANRPGAVCIGITATKFLHPVRPGDVLAIEWTETAVGEMRFTGTIAPAGPRAVSGALRLGPP